MAVKSELAREIHRDYLRKHLKEVEALISVWVGQLMAPDPFFDGSRSWGWSGEYRPDTESDEEKNRMIRGHVRSRQLWRHYARWTTLKSQAWPLVQEIRRKADSTFQNISEKNPDWKLHENYSRIGLWQAFVVARGDEMDERYEPPGDGIGYTFAQHKIATSCGSAADCRAVEASHRRFINKIASLPGMQELVTVWQEMTSLSEKMQALARKVLKARDFVYMCLYCRRHWV